MNQFDYERLYSKLDPFFEQTIEYLYRQLISTGDAVVDGGANVGVHTFPLSKAVGNAGKVYAIEALPHLATQLRAQINTRLIRNVEVVNCAVGDSVGEVEFNWVKNDEGYSGVRPRDYPAGVQIDKIKSRMLTLDTILRSEVRAVSFIKLDLEGGEFATLQGARETLGRNRTVIVFENGREETRKYWDYSVTEFFEFFKSIDYDITDLFLRPLSVETWQAQHWPWYFISTPRSTVLRMRTETILRPYLQLHSV